jgi:hypothetical protein
MRNDSPEEMAAFIISHGRPNDVITYDALRNHGFSGRIVIIIDNLDKTADQYYERYGHEHVVMFDKLEIAKTFDIGDNFDNYRSTSYARNAAFDIAEQLGIKYFIVLDDDYNDFRYRFDDRLQYIPACRKARNLDQLFGSMLQFMINCPQVHSIAMAQGGDYIGGEDNPFAQKVGTKRKCMNSFICCTDRRFEFISRMNEDVNTYVRHGSVGMIFFTLNQVSLNQKQTQATAGGMTELYKSLGTYVKSFYSVMYMPSAVKVRMMHTNNRRIHHAVRWNNTTPMIIPERFRKEFE